MSRCIACLPARHLLRLAPTKAVRNCQFADGGLNYLKNAMLLRLRFYSHSAALFLVVSLIAVIKDWT